MDVLEMVQLFPMTPEEPIFTVVIYKEDHQLYVARTNDRWIQKIEIKPERLEGKVRIPNIAFQPQYSKCLTQAPIATNLYIKRPSLTSCYEVRYIENNMIADGVLREAHICELLRAQPHRSIAEYVGCEVEDGRISGLCFVKYKESLMQRLNPGSLGKRAFANSHHLDPVWCGSIIDGVKKALYHLHTLGLAHNDLNPSNIMLDDEDTPRLIDFGSCRVIGESLQDVGRTYEWYDEKVQIASKRNDWDALAEISAWMNGKACDFSFDEWLSQSMC